MKKIDFYKTCRSSEGDAVELKQNNGHKIHVTFKKASGYLYECKNGVIMAIHKEGKQWALTETTTGLAVTCLAGRTLKEAQNLAETVADKTLQQIKNDNIAQQCPKHIAKLFQEGAKA